MTYFCLTHFLVYLGICLRQWLIRQLTQMDLKTQIFPTGMTLCLRFLPSYRVCKPSERHIYKSSPLFGQLHNVKKTGILQVGDVVYKINR